MKLFKETRDKAKALGIEVEDISAKLESVELVLNGTVTSRHIRGADALTVVDADSTATACGPYVSIDIISFYTVQFRRLALKSTPLGPKWDRWAKKLGCASNPPIPAVCRLEDWMRTRVFSPTYPTWAQVGGLQGQPAKL